MRIVRLLLGIPLLLVGAYLALVSLLASCVVQSQGVAEGDPVQILLLSQGLPATLGSWVVGIVGMLLGGLGFGIAFGGDGR